MKNNISPIKEKPLKRKAYGSIGHLPNSRRGKKDHGVPQGQADILTKKIRDKNDLIIVQEKLDGGNVAVAKIDGKILPLGRSGYLARTSPYTQHHLFDEWIMERYGIFDNFLNEGEWVSGEWLAQAHGTLYDLTGKSPFVVFDLWTNGKRCLYHDLVERSINHNIQLAPLLWCDRNPISVEDVLWMLGDSGDYGAKESPEGAVWRCERDNRVDFLAKYVRLDKVDGKYLPERNGDKIIWNYNPRNK